MSEVATEAAKVDVKSMSKTERTELRRIVRRRFKMLREQLSRRERELFHALKTQAEQEREDAVKEIEKKMKPLIKRQNDLAKAIEKVEEEAYKKDVKISGNLAKRLTLGSKYDGIEIRARGDIASSEAAKQLQEIKEEAGWQRLNLEELEWRLDEQLAVGELESGSSKDFLTTLPTVESLLPLPAGVELPAIES